MKSREERITSIVNIKHYYRRPAAMAPGVALGEIDCLKFIILHNIFMPGVIKSNTVFVSGIDANMIQNVYI